MSKDWKNKIKNWKPIHLCWWYESRGKPVPRYLIAGGGTAPTVVTNSATSIGPTSATGNGDITSDGGKVIDERGFVFSSTDTTPTIGESGVTQIIEGGTATGLFSDTLTPLSASTTYYYQAYATNVKGTSYGGVQSFATTGATSYDVDVGDDIDVSEDITINTFQAVLEVNVGDNIDVSEDITIETFQTVYEINLNDPVYISEDIQSEVFQPVRSLSVFDPVYISESVTVEAPRAVEIDSGFVNVSGDTTTSTTLEDVDSASFTVTLPTTGYILAWMSVESSSGSVNKYGWWAIDIDGNTSPEIQRWHSAGGDKGSVGVTYRSPQLSAGTYTVKAQHRTESGNTLTSSVNLVAISTISESLHDLPSVYDTVASDTTTSSSLEAIDGLTQGITTADTGHIFGALMASQSVSAGGQDVELNLDINGWDATVKRAVSGTDTGSVNVINRTDSEIALNTYTIKGDHSTTGGTLTTAPSILTALGMAADGGWQMPTDKIFVDAGSTSTTSATLEDIDFTGDTIILDTDSYVVAVMTVGANSTASAEAQFAINIDGTDYGTIARTFSVNDDGSVIVVARTSAKLPQGTYTVKGRWATSNGTLSNSGDISLVSFATQVSLDVIPKVRASVNDPVYTSENIESLVPIQTISVFDSIDVSESTTALIPSGQANVFDEVFVSENIEAIEQPEQELSVSDDITVTENVEIKIPIYYISVSDDIDVSESVTLSSDYNISVNDSVDVTSIIPDRGDFIEVSEDTQGDTDTFIHINLFDLVDVSESVSVDFLTGTREVNVNDSIDVSSLIPEDPDYIEVSEDTQADQQTTQTINVFDSVDVSESISLSGTYYINLADNVDVTSIIPDRGDFIEVSEDTTVDANIDFYAVSVFDSVEVSESITVETSTPTPQISVADDIEVSSLIPEDPDYIEVSEDTTGEQKTHINISISDDIDVSENITLERVDVPDLNISVFDSVEVSELEFLTFGVPSACVIDQQQTLNTNNWDFADDSILQIGQTFIPSFNADLCNIQVQVGNNYYTDGQLYLEIYTDNAGQPDTLLAEADDRINTLDLDWRNGFHTVNFQFTDTTVSLTGGTTYWFILKSTVQSSDDGGLTVRTDSNTPYGGGTLQRLDWNAGGVWSSEPVHDLYFKEYYDNTTITGYSVSVSDNIEVSENITLERIVPLEISVSDNIDVNEDIEAIEQPIQALSISDNINVSESISFEIITPAQISVADDIEVSEDITVFIPILYLSISDDISVSEYIALNTWLYIVTQDDVEISESVGAGTAIGGDTTSDDVTVGESVSAEKIPFTFNWRDEYSKRPEWIDQTEPSDSWTGAGAGTPEWTDESDITDDWDDETSNAPEWTDEKEYGTND